LKYLKNKMKILILFVLVVSICVCVDALITLKMIRKLKKILKHLKKERLEDANRSGKFTFKDTGLKLN
jgi:hypothetical protein